MVTQACLCLSRYGYCLVWTSLVLLTSLQRTFTIQDPPAGYQSHFEGKEKSRSSRMRMRATCLYSSSITLRKGLGLDSWARGAVLPRRRGSGKVLGACSRSFRGGLSRAGSRLAIQRFLGHFASLRIDPGGTPCLQCEEGLNQPHENASYPPLFILHDPPVECRSRFEGIERGGSGHMRVR
ncbi:hypothetical protein EDD15DRAFT_1502540 [Pisolithus albus]|nr:hypothetical protein EDD15DRAFT_1502540 [Pisolithus albus]